MRIRKNQKKRIAEISEKIKEITVFSLDNYFRGKTYPVNEMYGVQKAGSVAVWIEKSLSGRDILTETSATSWTLHVHSNLWFEMTA